MKNVLLINSNREIAARMLQDRKDVRLSVITPPKHRDYYDDDTDVEVVDSIADLTQVRLAALRIRERNPFEYVVSPAEWSIQAGGYIRSYFGLPGVDYKVANAFSNKYVMKQELAAAGLPVARFRLLSQLTDALTVGDDLGWPMVIKRACGGGSGYVLAVHDADHLRSLATDNSTARLRAAPFPMMAEELIDIEAEFHCDGVVRDGKVRFAPVSRYFKPVLRSVGGVIGSYSLPDDHPETRVVSDLHDRVVAALGLTDGVTHLEVFKSSHGYLIGEIACRPGGGGIPEQVQHQYGVDLWSVFLDVSMGETVDINTSPRSDHMIQYMLPRPAGTVTAITPAESLLSVPGVVYADVKTKVGDLVGGPLDSSIYAGVVVMRAESEAQVHERVAQIDARFRVEVAKDGKRPTTPAAGTSESA
ncbi:ATP-grasp domain-containing protein [Streptomyces inhibens]|uniref:ATP-grasp domain-containing protein n=1 Tax=Streptomyces inhibens TaxID=2293571 RepID=A0A371PPU6_STRIH|nr:ATP-grasp domain-containing protein [Streptomyces inhibens]REK84544.1 ATP-grasp domain-containing protein [Streptomyces inhibens]